MRTGTAVLVTLGVLVLAGLAWLLYQAPNESYEYGYAGAFVEADRLWSTTMPPASTCDAMAAEAIRRNGALNYDEVVGGCRSGYYDAVTHTRGRLGYPPLP